MCAQVTIYRPYWQPPNHGGHQFCTNVPKNQPPKQPPAHCRLSRLREAQMSSASWYFSHEWSVLMTRAVTLKLWTYCQGPPRQMLRCHLLVPHHAAWFSSAAQGCTVFLRPQKWFHGGRHSGQGCAADPQPPGSRPASAVGPRQGPWPMLAKREKSRSRHSRERCSRCGWLRDLASENFWMMWCPDSKLTNI